MSSTTINPVEPPEYDTDEPPECPTCDADHFDTWHGVKNHHARVHDISLTRKIVECSYCGTEFAKDKTAYHQAERHFCSDEHANKWRSEYNLENGIVPPNREGMRTGKITKECANCNEEITRHPSQFPGEHAFCSRRCVNVWQKEQYEPYDPVDAHGHSWRTYRRAILHRDDCTCQHCGYEGSVRATGEERQLHVHHIVPRRYFDTKLEANDPENLVTLCHNCHVNVEQGNIECPESNGSIANVDHYKDSPWAEQRRTVERGKNPWTLLRVLTERAWMGTNELERYLDTEDKCETYVSSIVRSLKRDDLVVSRDAEHPSGNDWSYSEYRITERGIAALKLGGFMDEQ